jgi:hypothetical protein
VSRVSATRVVDVGTRRVQLQRKVGAGLDVKDFGQVSGHIGLRESACMIADRLGWGFEGMEETLEPAVSPTDQRTAYLSVKQGQVAGVHQVVWLDLTMAVGADHPRDEIEIEGTPPLNLLIERGVQGDAATAAIAINAVPAVVATAPGLLTMADLPLTPPPGLTASPHGARK